MQKMNLKKATALNIEKYLFQEWIRSKNILLDILCYMSGHKIDTGKVRTKNYYPRTCVELFSKFASSWEQLSWGVPLSVLDFLLDKTDVQLKLFKSTFFILKNHGKQNSKSK